MDHDQALAALVAAKAQCSDACVDETVHAPHRAAVEQAYADYAAASREQAQKAVFMPDEPPGIVTVSTSESNTIPTAEPTTTEGA